MCAQRQPPHLEEKAFQNFTGEKRPEKGHRLGQIGNADQITVYLGMPAAYTGKEEGAKHAKIPGYEKQRDVALHGRWVTAAALQHFQAEVSSNRGSFP